MRDISEKTFQGGYNPVGAFVLTQDYSSVFFYLFIRLAVINDDEFR
jgi:hypothetical protein